MTTMLRLCTIAIAIAIGFGLAMAVAPLAAGEASALWGSDGSAWNPTSRLPDFASSGYQSGRDAIPTYPVGADVMRFGAKGDGISDDTAAFTEALKAVPEGHAVFIPAGRYVLTEVVRINRSRIALRGEGPEKTILVIPKPLSEINPKGKVDGTMSVYAFTGGFLTMQGADKGKPVGDVVAPAARGETRLTLSSTAGLSVGDWIRLILRDPEDHSLLKHLHGEAAEPGPDTILHGGKPVDWAARITGLDGTTISLDRPLRVDVRPAWKGVVWTMRPTLMDSGIEDLGFEFPGVPKLPHLHEAGYNAIQITGAVDCWIRAVTASDADNGVILNGTRFCTVDGFVSKAVKRSGITGHHALWATGRAQDNLIIRFRCDTMYVHDLTVEGFACGNVFTQGSGVSINCDHHRNAPYENCFTDINIGDARRLFDSGGRPDRGPNSGARTTFWGIRGTGPFPKLPGANDFPLMNLVGVGTYQPSESATGFWIEPLDGAVVPANLWEAQSQRKALGPH